MQDYVVVKIPRFDFPKFPSTDDLLGTSMQSIGEVMSISSTFNESLTKAIRSLETGKTGIRDFSQSLYRLSDSELEHEILTPRPRRIFSIFESLRRGWEPERISSLSKIDLWFIFELQKSFKADLDTTPLEILKKLGWTIEDIGIKNSFDDCNVFKLVDTCSAEFPSKTPYIYSTSGQESDDQPSKKRKVIVIGSGPNRIGQGIEFDYCCVHGINALKDAGYEAIMINSNPETVSTDYDTADKLYFEPLSWYEVKSVLDREKPDSVLIQLGGQTPLKLAKNINSSNYKIAGSSLEVIESTEDRELFNKLCSTLEIKQPKSKIANNETELKQSILEIGFPVLLRPSYVLGGRAMRVVNNSIELEKYINALSKSDEEGNPFASGPLLVDEFLTNAIEIDVDLISDGKEVFIAGILEHLEPAGVHSGDSTAVLPPFSLTDNIVKNIKTKSKQLALRLDVKGLLNIQFALKNNELFILEANPRASRTMPFVAKVTGNQIIKAGTLLMLNYSLKDVRKKTDYLNKKSSKVAVKKAVFPWSRFPAEDTMLGPEMKATGEVLGVGSTFGVALDKAYAASGVEFDLKNKGLFVSLSDDQKENFLEIIRKFSKLDFKIYSTKGTNKFLISINISSTNVGRADEDNPTSLTIIENNLVSIVINTPTFENEQRDGWKIRRLAHNKGAAVVSSVREASALLEIFTDNKNSYDDINKIKNVS